jgi:hypothetical protein
MASIDSLRRQVAALREKIGKPGDPRRWIFALCGDRQIPDHIRAQIREQDEVFIRRVVSEFGDFNAESMSCTVVTTGRNYIVNMATGEWRQVLKSI